MSFPTDLQPEVGLLNDCLLRQRAAFLKESPPTLAERRAKLKKLRGAILARKPEIERALIADFGNRASHETAIMEVMTMIQGIDYLHANLRRFMRPQKRHVPLPFQPANAYVAYQPLGVIGIMSPWNYPIALALMPLATAIAAGNRAMIKPSEMTPVSSSLITQMLGEIFTVEEVAVFTGDATVGAAFSKLAFDHLFFTGSTQVGRMVMKAASENLVPVTLELGGKSPVIIAPNHPLEHAAREIAQGKLANCGQTCIAPDYVMVHESQADQFLQAYDHAVRKFYPAGPLSDQYTSIINEHHFRRLSSLVDDARDKKARVVEVGINPHEAVQRPHSLPPVVVLDVSDEMSIMQEEIFGPLLPVVTYQDIEGAIAFVNARPRPLALYYFGDDNDDRQKVMTRTTSGNLTINTTILHYALDDLPFGGVGPSGIGAYHGVEGFKSMSHAKGTLVFRRWNMSNLLKPPFGTLADLVLKVMLR
ncbi:coniferyl aldehyde dehydrogenase [Methylobacillus arboreus]|uniref:coniferyl aldehyde dehydrogenase n=1 Tax=Methylobacillus arboreus TaxID=755170 RepID=UPI001E588ECF|nr:coniferyl aldehyde dehydrogenase [Methylobacillus arboreus]MCB5191526.1 coniferyl aldehyde dehydrogenase [Methylobacillus arboreus]